MYKNNSLAAKRRGNCRFLCNFVGMKQNLSDIIRGNKELQKILQKQEGGIMKFWAEHLDVRGPELFRSYQDQCDAEFFENHEWDLGMTLPRDEMRCKALGSNHIESELGYLTDLKTALSDMRPELSSLVISYAEKYLTYAYNEKRKRNFPNGMTPQDLYEEVMGLYRSGGLANDCMKILLIEHDSPGIIEETPWYRNTMFNIRMKSSVLGNWRVEPDLRQAVAKMLDGKTTEECRYLAIKMMKEVKGFSQMLYSKKPMAVTYLGFDIDEIKVDKEWLRDVAKHAGLNEHNKQKKSARYYFSDLVFLLMQIGRIWAAQLLANHGVDMHDLEVETDCILKPAEKGDYDYYVDKLIGDSSLTQRFVVDEDHARKLLSKIKPVESIEEETQKKGKKQDTDAHKKQADTTAPKDSVLPSGSDEVSSQLPPPSITEQWEPKCNVAGQQETSSPKDEQNKKAEDNPKDYPNSKPLPIPKGRLNTPDAQRYFRKAIEAGYMKCENGIFEWIGVTGIENKKKSQLAYFCGKVYGYQWGVLDEKSGVKGNIGTELPEDNLIVLFKVNKLCHLLHQVYSAKKVQGWRGFIDQLFV